jgi:hypothetical protein
MTLNIIVLAGGLLVLAVGVLTHFTRSRNSDVTTDQVSGDWLAEARGKEEQPW